MDTSLVGTCLIDMTLSNSHLSIQQSGRHLDTESKLWAEKMFMQMNKHKVIIKQHWIFFEGWKDKNQRFLSWRDSWNFGWVDILSGECVIVDARFFLCKCLLLIVKVLNLSFFVQVTWLDGHSLIQTVFICLYVHDPYIIEDPCLKVNLIIESQRYQGLLYWGEGSVPSLGHMGCGGGGYNFSW